MADKNLTEIKWNDGTSLSVGDTFIILKNAQNTEGDKIEFLDFNKCSPDEQITTIEEVLIPLYNEINNNKNAIIADILAIKMNCPGYEGVSLEDVFERAEDPRRYKNLPSDNLLKAKEIAYKNAANAVNESSAQGEAAKQALDAAKITFNNIVDSKARDNSLFPNFKDQNTSGKKEIGDLIVKLYSDPNNKTNIMLADLIAIGSQCPGYDDMSFDTTFCISKFFSHHHNRAYERLDPKRFEKFKTELNALNNTVVNNLTQSQESSSNTQVSDENDGTQNPDSLPNNGNNLTATPANIVDSFNFYITEHNYPITKDGKPLPVNITAQEMLSEDYKNRFSNFNELPLKDQLNIEALLEMISLAEENKKEAALLAASMKCPGFTDENNSDSIIKAIIENRLDNYEDRFGTLKKDLYKRAVEAYNESQIEGEVAKKALDAAKKAFNNIANGKEPDSSLFPIFKDQNDLGKKEIENLLTSLYKDNLQKEPNEINLANGLLANLIITGSQCPFYDNEKYDFSKVTDSIHTFLSGSGYYELDLDLEKEFDPRNNTVVNNLTQSQGNDDTGTSAGTQSTNTQNPDSTTNTGNNLTATPAGTQSVSTQNPDSSTNTGNNPTGTPAGTQSVSTQDPESSTNNGNNLTVTPANTQNSESSTNNGNNPTGSPTSTPVPTPAPTPAPQAKETTVHKYAEEDYIRAQKRVEAHIKRGLITKEEADKALAQIQQMEKEGKIPTGLSADGKSTRSNAIIYLYKAFQSEILYHPDEPVYTVENGKVTKQKECSVSEKLGGSNRDLVKGLAEGNASAEHIMKTEDAISEKGHAVLGVKVKQPKISFKPGRNPGYEESKIYTDENGNIVPKPQENTSQSPASALARSEENGMTGSGNGVNNALAQHSGGTVNVSQDTENKRQSGTKQGKELS